MRFIALLITIFSVAACQFPSAADTPHPLYWLNWSGPVLDTAYLAAAEEAAADWNTALDRSVFAFGWRPFVGIDITQIPYKMPLKDGTLATGLTYLKHFPTPLIAVSTDVDRSVYRVIVEHELGHILGLTHSDDPNDLMYLTPGRQTRVTENDKRRALGILESQAVKSQY